MPARSFSHVEPNRTNASIFLPPPSPQSNTGPSRCCSRHPSHQEEINQIWLAHHHHQSWGPSSKTNIIMIHTWRAESGQRSFLPLFSLKLFSSSSSISFDLWNTLNKFGISSLSLTFFPRSLPPLSWRFFSSSIANNNSLTNNNSFLFSPKKEQQKSWSKYTFFPTLCSSSKFFFDDDQLIND